ncbi:MAG: helix-turn-helix transcriptional regulator [Spirochaetia bacterium]|nr:helix-turn-helix transcriptional regulator [Spirochaetia bacterium]
MQIVLKDNKIKIDMKGDIPLKIIEAVKSVFQTAKVFNDAGEEIIIASESKWLQKLIKETKPQKIVSLYRENRKLSQSELGKKIGQTGKYISDIENGRRNISIKTAKKLAEVFDISWMRFFNETRRR